MFAGGTCSAGSSTSTTASRRDRIRVSDPHGVCAAPVTGSREDRARPPDGVPFRSQQVDAILNHCVDSLDKIKAATVRPPTPLTSAPPLAARAGLIADVDTFERYTWAVEQAQQGILPTSVVDQDGLDGLRGDLRRLWRTQHERVLRDQEPEELPRDEGPPVLDRVTAARDAIRDGRAASAWRSRP
jgi:hypothetical protein